MMTRDQVFTIREAGLRGFLSLITMAAVFAFSPASFAVVMTPSVTDSTTDEDVQTTTGLVITANPGEMGQVTSHYKITNITNGNLFQNNGTSSISNNDFITLAEGSAGLKFTPDGDFFGAGSFDIQASNAANNGGLDGSVITATITVNAVADTP
ncbi:MAG: hypothetical protein AAB353_07605, partial [Candidatus Hydrogenedentota bacterium]